MTIIPMFGEQPHNAKTAAKLGVATMLNKFKLTKNYVLKEVLTVNIFIFLKKEK